MLGDGSEILSYLIEAVDTASPVLRAVQEQFIATSRVAQASLGEIAKSADAATLSLGKMSGATKAAAGSETQAAGAATRLADSQKAVADSTKVAAGATAKLDTAQVGALASAGALSRSHGDLAKASGVAAGATKAHTNVLTDLSGKLATGSTATRQWGSALSALTVPLAAVGGASLFASAKFGALMEQLRTQAGYSQQSVNQLSAAVVKLSPSLAQTPDQLALALYHIASVGIPASKAINVLRASTEGANISGANLDDTANALSTTLKNFPTIAGGATGAMADLVAIVGHGNLHLQDLVTNLGKVVPVAKSIGLTLPDVGAAIDVLTSHGLAASQATTALRFAFTSLERPSATALGALGEIGLGQAKLAEDMTKPDGLLVALRDLKSHLDTAFPPGQPLSVQQQQEAIDKYATSLKNAGTAASTYKSDMAKYYELITSGAGSKVLQSQAILNIFGGARGAQGALPLLQNIPELAGLYQKIPVGKTAIDQLNASVAAWDKTQSAQLQHLKAGIVAAGVAIGQDLGPVVIPVLTTITHGVEDIAKAFSDMPGPMKTAIGALLGIGVVVGPLLLVISKVMRIGSLLSGLGGRMLGGGAGAAGGGIGGALGGEMNAGMIFGVRGPAAPGSITNPIAVAMEGQPAWRGALGGAAGTATEAEVLGGTEGAGFLGTIRAGLPSVIGSVMRGGMIALGGSFAAQIAGSLIGGNTGRVVGSAGTDAAYGAGVGSLLGPAGTIAGGAIGGLFGLASGLSSNSMSAKEVSDVLTAQANDMKSYAGNVQDVQLALSGMLGTITADVPAGTARVKTMLAAFGSAGAAIQTGMDQGNVSIGKGMSGLLSIISQENAKGVTSFKTSMGQIDSVLKMPTAQDNLTAAMKAMVSSIQQQMQDGQISVQKGVSEINQILSKIKKTVDINIVVHQQYAAQQTPLGYNQGMAAIGNVDSAAGRRNYKPSKSTAGPKSGIVATSVGSGETGFAKSFLSSIGAPITPAAMTALYSWWSAEEGSNVLVPGHGGTNNPFEIAGNQGVAGDLGPTTGAAGAAGVQNYATAQEGIQAAINYFSRYAYISNVLQAFRSGGSTASIEQAVRGLGPVAFGSDTALPWGITSPTSSGSGTGGGGKVTIPPYAPGKTPGKSQHFDWRTGKFELMTAAAFKTLQQSWHAAHPGKAYPANLTALETDLYGPLRTKAPPGGSVSEFLSLSDTPGAMARGETALRSSLTQTSAAIVAASSAAIGANAGAVDSAGLTQLQTLIKEARITHNQQLITGFLKDANLVVKSWDSSLKSNFQTDLSTATLTEQLAINNAQLGLSPTARATVNKKGVITFAKATASPNPAATAATDPAYLQAQIAAYGTYIANLGTEKSDLQGVLKQEQQHPKKNKTLIDNTKAQIEQVQQALLQANVDVSGIESAFKTAVYQAFVTNFQTIEQGLEGQSSNAGTLASAAESLGTAAGTSFSALQALSSQQGGLTGPQTAQANADLASFIQGQYGQEAPLVGAGNAGAGLGGLLGPIISQMQSGGASQGQYGGWASLFGGNNSALGADFTALASGQLSASDQASTITSVDNLLSTLAGLIAAITTQTTATNQLTGATVQNTAVVSTFGGQVTFTIGGDQSGQSYIAGETPASTMTSHLGTGM